MLLINEIKKIRERLELTHIVIYGLDSNQRQYVATHGKTVKNAREAAKAGNKLKSALGWPEELCEDEPLERICGNCSFWTPEYHRPGDIIKKNPLGCCVAAPESVSRSQQDRACLAGFEPTT